MDHNSSLGYPGFLGLSIYEQVRCISLKFLIEFSTNTRIRYAPVNLYENDLKNIVWKNKIYILDRINIFGP